MATLVFRFEQSVSQLHYRRRGTPDVFAGRTRENLPPRSRSVRTTSRLPLPHLPVGEQGARETGHLVYGTQVVASKLTALLRNPAQFLPQL